MKALTVTRTAVGATLLVVGYVIGTISRVLIAMGGGRAFDDNAIELYKRHDEYRP